ncbi:uncharacterized protein LOC102673408 isoform X2 [Apis dorsata]|uniref:uncharacterized protein LOC102673408 isoform X2 n=1 Tax=Apis dorsata TaxID=7462 RepID=UPI0003DF6BFE|nr:uncharacterized protein LOC102673408 isoform X2 [Apis dorsata]
MAQNIAILSTIPRLSYHLQMQLPNLMIFDVSPDKCDTLSKLQNADILITDCDLFLPYTNKLPSLKWVQTTWAAMSEYVIAHIFNFERNQKEQYQNQKHNQWIKDGKISDHRLICDLSVGILGLGNIGKSIAEKLKIFGATVWGVSRTPLKENLNYLDEHRTIAYLSEMLTNCDYIINVLPSTPNTLGLLNGNVLQNCKNRGSVFINIGRGTIIKEADLLHALEQQWILGAILDVFEEEPLSKESKLWTLPQVTISPHISGTSRAQDIVKFFIQNYEKYIKGEKLLNTVNLVEGY